MLDLEIRKSLMTSIEHFGKVVWTRVRFPKDKEEVCTEKVKNAVYLFMSLTLGVWMNQKIFYVILKKR